MLFLNDTYYYDANGNVASILDGATGRGHRGDRDMDYDALDRLMSAASPMFGNGTTGTVSFSHDVLDNLTHLTMPATGPTHPMPARDQFYCYDANWRLTSLRDADGCAGNSLVDLTYDVQGNLATKGTDTYTFGKNNRLYFAPSKGELYYYDAQGHRTLQNAVAGNILSQYTQDGQLLQITDNRAGFTSSYISLGGSLVAIRKKAISGGVITVEYQHTDALGTPVAVTDANRNVIERSEYEPYGLLLNRAQHDGPGFTGHVQDALTGLTYMQQRYYDPMIGGFLSVDPVTAYEKPLTNFCRYCYARDNPYRFTDPDGRNGVTFVGGLLYETGQFLSGNGFDGSHLRGALADGYNGEGGGRIQAAVDDATTFIPIGGAEKATVEVAEKVAVAGKEAISMSEAVDKAIAHVGSDAEVMLTKRGNVQFSSSAVDSAGNTVTKNARFDVSPNTGHGGGPHLNLETQIKSPTGQIKKLPDPHTEIKPETIRRGDYK